MIVRLKHVHTVKAKGRAYHYFRPTKQKIKAPYGTEAFLSEYQSLLAAWEKKADPGPPGTLGALMTAYRASPEFAAKADRTKADYRDVMDYLAPLGNLPLVKFDTPLIMQIRDKAFTKHKRRFANYVLSVLSLLFNWGMPRGYTTGNPVDKAETVAKPRNAPVVNRPWTADEFATVMEAMPPELRIAAALGAYAGIRQGDVLTLPWSAYDGDVIAARASKTNEPIWVPAHSELRKLLSAAPRKSPIIVVGVRGHPFTSNGFRTRFFRVIRSLELSGKIGKGLTFHGLRHTAATALADAGCDTRDIMSITGHKTEAMVARYTQSADQKRRARSAIAKLEGVNSEQTIVKPDAANCKTAK